MTPQEYQDHCAETAGYAHLNKVTVGTLTAAQYAKITDLNYVALGLAGEAGEVANKVKKILRDDGGVITPIKREGVLDELGDVLWYLTRTAHDLDSSLEEVMDMNIAKLKRRERAGTLHGSGDKR